MTRCLDVPYKCLKFWLNISYGYQVIERTHFCDGQTHEQMQGGKIYMQELWFLCMACRLNVVYHNSALECLEKFPFDHLQCYFVPALNLDSH